MLIETRTADTVPFALVVDPPISEWRVYDPASEYKLTIEALQRLETGNHNFLVIDGDIYLAPNEDSRSHKGLLDAVGRLLAEDGKAHIIGDAGQMHVRVTRSAHIGEVTQVIIMPFGGSHEIYPWFTGEEAGRSDTFAKLRAMGEEAKEIDAPAQLLVMEFYQAPVSRVTRQTGTLHHEQIYSFT